MAKNETNSLNLTAIVESWVDAFNRTDIEDIIVHYEENSVVHKVAEAPVKGKKAIRQMYAKDFATSKLTCIVDNVYENGEWAMLEWRDSCGLRGFVFFRIVNGKFHFQKHYWDDLSLLIQHGPPLPTDWCSKR